MGNKKHTKNSFFTALCPTFLMLQVTTLPAIIKHTCCIVSVLIMIPCYEFFNKHCYRVVSLRNSKVRFS